MFQKIKSFISKRAKKVIFGIVAAAFTCIPLSISAYAAEGTESGSNMASVINTAGTSLSAEFSNLVTAIVPVLIGIALVGLGLYAVIYLFKMAKKFFAQAAG